MIILGISTSTASVGCALGGHEGVIASFHSARDRRHAETLTPAIQFLLEQVQMQPAQISCIAVDIGPGLFTGLRVGIATGKAMALALRVPMIGISSLDLLAFPARWSDRLIVPVIDAKRGEVFSSTYRRVAGGVQRLSEPTVSTASHLGEMLQGEPDEVLFVGDGALSYEDQLKRVENADFGAAAEAHPLPDALVGLAHPKAIREEFVRTDEIAPLYLRRPDAEPNVPKPNARAVL